MQDRLPRHRQLSLRTSSGAVAPLDEVEESAREEHELALRLTMVRVGVWTTLLASAAVAVYAILSWNEPHRHLFMAVAGLAILSAIVVDRMPADRIVRSRLREPFFFSWSIAEIALVTVLCVADGGVDSPFAFLYVLPLLFATLSYPLPATIAVGGIVVLSFIGVAIAAGDDVLFTGFGSFVLLAAAMMASWEASSQAHRRRLLTTTTAELARSSAASRRQARQQEEVARLGQRALSGMSLGDLCTEATESVSRELEAPICALLRLADEDRLVATAATGLPDELIGVVAIPTGTDSQAGYTLSTRAPMVVEDWLTETRFARSQVLTDAGARSGLTTLVQASGHDYGVLGVQSLEPGWFGPDDISFVQSVANVLGQAIERRDREERIRHDALHDPLTDLPNRNLFLDRLEQSLARALVRASHVAVLFIDLDQFKRINDGLGHSAGDELLIAVGARLEESVGNAHTVARFGGDEFVVLVNDVEDEAEVIALVQRLIAGIERPFELRGIEHFVTATIGIALGDGSEAPGALMRDADAALYDAKDGDRGGFEVFHSLTRARMLDHMETENDLRRAIERDQLRVHYQPIIRLSDYSIVSFEALVRWEHPDRGLLGPGSFIRLAEDSNLIRSIGSWVLHEAFRHAAAWQALSPDDAPIGIGVNLSARQLADPDLIRIVAAATADAGIDPSTVRLELTESVLLQDSDSAIETLRTLRELGIRIALDDFGSGFSSLGYLKRLPLDSIKLDRSFIEGLVGSATDEAIVSAVVQLAATLNLGVVAEGIETPEQLEVVEQLGCGFAQGFHFARPVPSDQVDALIAATPWLISVPGNGSPFVPDPRVQDPRGRADRDRTGLPPLRGAPGPPHRPLGL